jgi:hypothetical protein
VAIVAYMLDGNLGQVATRSPICEAARRAARSHDAASATLISLLERPIASHQTSRIAQRVRELRRLFDRLSVDEACLLRTRLNDRGDALARFFDCELSTAMRDDLRARLERSCRSSRSPVTNPVAAPSTRATATHRPPRDVADWRDLVRFRVPPHVVSGLRARRGSTYTVQTIESARSSDVNLDYYPVYVSLMPVVKGVRLDAARLFDLLRANINQFIDTSLTTFSPAALVDAARWRTRDPRGTVFYLDLKGPDNAYVVCSDIAPTYWRFTTVTQHRKLDASGSPVDVTGSPVDVTDEHPVSGTREFGYTGAPERAIFYTKGADRGSYWLEAVNRQAFAGGHRLWLSFQRGLVDFVTKNNGRATTFMIGERGEPSISARHNWRQLDRRLG